MFEDSLLVLYQQQQIREMMKRRMLVTLAPRLKYGRMLSEKFSGSGVVLAVVVVVVVVVVVFSRSILF